MELDGLAKEDREKLALAATHQENKGHQYSTQAYYHTTLPHHITILYITNLLRNCHVTQPAAAL